MMRVRRRARGDSFVEETLRSAGRSLGGSLAARVRETVRWLVRRTTTGAVGIAMLVTASVFLLVAGVEGLKAASLPEWAAYLILGGFAILAGGALLLKAQSRSDS